MRVILLLLMCTSSFALESKQLEEVAYSPTWLKLLHYKKRWFGGYKGNADAKEFWVAENGKYDPLAELQANIRAFQHKKKLPEEKWHPQCRFPARYRFIKEHLPGIKFADQHCEDFLWWKNRISAKSISIVFSSYYSGNPASIFGHTFIKLNTSESNQERISDFALDFAAFTRDDPAIIYMYKGLFGGYPGRFSTPAYYEKINNYVHIDSRDLWEYLLDYTPAEVEKFLEHVWELKMSSYFDYYFFDENCSYMLLESLDFLRPERDLSRPYFFYALPIDTVKRVAELGGVRESRFRPSFRKKMLTKQKILSPQQFEAYTKIIDGESTYKESKDKEVLEALIAYYRFKKFENSEYENEVKHYTSKIREILVARAKLGGKTPGRDEVLLQEYEKYDPLKSHNSYMLALSHGHDNYDYAYSKLRYRSGLHGVFDNDLGFPRYSAIEFLGLEGKYYYERKRLVPSQVSILKIQDLSGIEPFDVRPSWGIDIGFYRPEDFYDFNKLVFRTRVEIGLAKYALNDWMAFYGMLGGNIEIANSFPQGSWRAGPQIEIGLRGRIGLDWSYAVASRAAWDLKENYDRDYYLQYEGGVTYTLNAKWALHTRYQQTLPSLKTLRQKKEGQLELRFMY